MSTVTGQYLTRAAATFKARQGEQLSELLLPDFNDPTIEAITDELVPDDVSIRQLVLQTLSDDDQTRLADIMGTVLQYIRDVGLVEEEHLSLLKSLRMSKIYESATKMFALPDYGWFNPCIQELTVRLLEEANEADDAQEDNSRDRFVASITMVTNGPLKTAAADTKQTDALHTIMPRPRDITFWLANLLLRGSFELRDTLASAEPILTYLAPQMDNLHLYTRAEQVTFHYHAGSVFLIKEELRTAHDHLKLAFDLCTINSFINKRLIFINLVTTSILLGIFPHPALLATFELTEQFLPLIHAIKAGDRSAYRLHLDSNVEWFRERFIYLILRSKGEILVLRNLFRRAFLISRALWPPAPESNTPPQIQLDLLLTAVRYSYRYSAIGDMDLSTWDVADIEALCASLIDQGYIQGYVYHARPCLVLRKHLGFPLISSVWARNEE